MQKQLKTSSSDIGLVRSIETVVLILMATGTVFVFSAGANVRASYDLPHFFNFTTLKQLLFFPIAVVVMYVVSYIDYHRFSFARKSGIRNITTGLLVLSIVLLILVLIPSVGRGIGPENRFARRWFDIIPGPAYLSFQPSELAKWSLIFFLAAFADYRAADIRNFKKGFIPACAIAGLVVALIVTQDFGTAAFIALLTFCMLLIAGARWWHFLTPLPIAVPMFYFAIVSSPTRLNRIRNFLNADSIAYQAQQSLIAISTGGLTGKGLGRGVFKFGHLPEDTTDFVFSIIAEELGFVGAAAVIALFAALVIMALVVIVRCNNRFGKMLAAGITLSIAIQAAVNIGVVTVVLPTKGIPLPFISAGGTSMLLSAAAVGVLLNIAKNLRTTDSGRDTVATADQPEAIDVGGSIRYGC